VNYSGFVGFNTDNPTELQPREHASFYFPVHYLEPVLSNERAIGFDLYSSASRRRTIDVCMKTRKPVLTDRLTLVQEKSKLDAFGVVLMHPGMNILVSHDQVWPRDLAIIVVRIHDLLLRSAEKHRRLSQIYIYDQSDFSGVPMFLGAAHVDPRIEAVRPSQTRRRNRRLLVTAFTPLPEVSLEEALTGTYYAQTIHAANKEWMVIVQKVEGTFEPTHVFVIFGGVIIFGASLCLAAWIYGNIKGERFKAKTEKAALILEAAQRSARRERELNDFIAHEVRNSVDAAMAACSFVKSTIYKEQPFPTRKI
jgi:hypothetical protein